MGVVGFVVRGGGFVEPRWILRLKRGVLFLEGVPSWPLDRLEENREGSTFSESNCSSS